MICWSMIAHHRYLQGQVHVEFRFDGRLQEIAAHHFHGHRGPKIKLPLHSRGVEIDGVAYLGGQLLDGLTELQHKNKLDLHVHVYVHVLYMYMNDRKIKGSIAE